MADPASSTGYVYFIRESRKGPIKIGWASDPKRRLMSLQCGNPRALRFIGMTPGTMLDEAAWHVRFGALRIGGEWFRSARDLLAAIDALPTIELPRGVTERGAVTVPADDWFKNMMRKQRQLPEPTQDDVRAALVAVEASSPAHINRGEVA